jgi:hypothetical protein
MLHKAVCGMTEVLGWLREMAMLIGILLLIAGVGGFAIQLVRAGLQAWTDLQDRRS